MAGGLDVVERAGAEFQEAEMGRKTSDEWAARKSGIGPIRSDHMRKTP
eukprot:CAMPEP_0194779970 /NCGR_PEP_ID=MMETSP0323_2-20130528/72419_1 /TAXON_ID=2866 ORGANISM="Crypthecodinium cohnii, Strain Seligo" /NCGR_SAMPLE_ID=MMETSP0323_2 /ASSEMBLY_ACC=CAM_ASM_000346 /LENGTH=47 /DNA_ID= /DNA_START= /DNA_END= /DNA_ORIENTATION=